jgi:hypothetical protein
MGSKHVVIVVVVGCAALAGLVVANAVQKKLSQSTPAPAAASNRPIVELPPDYDEPLKVISLVNTAKGTAREQALAQFVGKCTPKAGWEGTVTSITSESGGRTALRMSYSSSRVIGGEYWVVAIVGKDHGAKQGQTLRVYGRIKDVVFQTGPGSVTQSVVLEDVKVIP